LGKEFVEGLLIDADADPGNLGVRKLVFLTSAINAALMKPQVFGNLTSLEPTPLECHL
jgi:hypothetical protein